MSEQFILIMTIITMVAIFAFLGFVYYMFWKKSGEALRDQANHGSH